MHPSSSSSSSCSGAAASSSLAGKLRSEVRSSDATVRREVLRGAFNADTAGALRWKNPSWKLLVFVSSPFTDTQDERSFLVDEYQFRLRERGQRHGVQVIFVDMRWGIQDQNTADHKTWEACAKVIEWCKVESMGVAFLSLQGNKYGYTPLPRVVMESDMQSHLLECGCGGGDDVKRDISDWYQLDENSDPQNRYYVLKNLASVDDPEYWSAFQRMLPVLTGLPFDTTKFEGLRVGRSVTEWEVRAALGSYPCQLDRNDSVCWSFRNFTGDVDDGSFCDFRRGQQDVTETKWTDLVTYMKAEIPSGSIQECAMTMTDFKDKESRGYSEYFEAFRGFVQSRFDKSLDAIIDWQDQWAKDGIGVGIPGSRLFEMLHHCRFAREKCSKFIGREALVRSVVDAIRNDNRQADGEVMDALNPVHRFLGVCVAVVGVSGAGKTALMSKVASEYFAIRPEASVVIVRFCGTSPESTNAFRLMLSICAQIEYLHGVDDAKSDRLAGGKYEEVVTYFQSLLRDHPVILFIDSLDQLTDENQGRSQVSFLRGVRPHPHTRIIVSCLPDEREVNPETGLSYLYLCETRLKEAHVPRVEVRMAPDRAVEESMEIVDSLLRQRGRTLQQRQRDVVQERIAGVQEKTALYITLSVMVISKWTSDVDAASLLPGSVVDLIQQLFSSLEVEYGCKMTRLALAVLTFARKGVSDIELEDILSMSDDVLNSVFVYHSPTVRRLPTHVWLRLKGAMDGLIMEGENGCVQWYHRQLKETAERVYQPEKALAHSLMAHYFGNLRDDSPEFQHFLKVYDLRSDTVLKFHSGGEKLLFGDGARNISSQPWVVQGLPFMSDSLVNARRCCEASYHMIQNGLWDDAERELCNFEGVCSKIRCGEGYQLIRELARVIEAFESGPSDRQPSDRLIHYFRWLRQDIHLLSRNAVATFVASASAQPKISVVREEASSLNDVMYQVQTLGVSDNFGSMLSKLNGHGDCVSSVAFSPDGKTVASGSGDETIRLWDVATGEETSKLESHRAGVRCVAFSPDGMTLASGSEDKTIRLWDVTTREEKMKLEGHSEIVTSVAYSPDGRSLVSGSEDMTICLWDVATGEEKAKFEGHIDLVTCVAFSPDGMSVVSGSGDETIRLWDVTSGELMSKFEGHSADVLCVTFDPNGKNVASGSGDKTVRVWDISTGQQKITLESPKALVTCVAYSPDGKTLASGYADRTVRMWDVDTHQEKGKLEGHCDWVTTVAFSPDGKMIVSGSGDLDQTIRVWDVESRNGDIIQKGHSSRVNAVAISADGKTMASGSEDKTILLWNVSTWERIAKLEGHSMVVLSVAFSPDGKTMASGSNDYTCRVWNVATGEKLAVLEGHTSCVTSVAFNPDGMIVASGSRDSTIRVWDVERGKVKYKLEGHTRWVSSVAFSPNGEFLMSGSDDKTIRLWDVETGEEKNKLWGHTEGVNAVAFDPDGKSVASGSDDLTIRLWDVATGKEKMKLEGHFDAVISLAYSSNGKKLVTGSSDLTIRIWDVATGEEKTLLEGHSATVRSVVFSADYRAVVSGSEDSTARAFWGF